MLELREMIMFNLFAELNPTFELPPVVLVDNFAERATFVPLAILPNRFLSILISVIFVLNPSASNSPFTCLVGADGKSMP